MNNIRERSRFFGRFFFWFAPLLQEPQINERITFYRWANRIFQIKKNTVFWIKHTKEQGEEEEAEGKLEEWAWIQSICVNEIDFP